MFTKKTLRLVLLGAALFAGSFAGLTRAADEPAPKPVEPNTPAPTDRPRRNPADVIKNYRDQFEGLNLTDDQMKKIDAFIETAEVEVKKAAGSEDRDARRAAFQAIGKLNEDVNSVLNDTQKAQLAQKRQASMLDRFKAPYLNPELKLTDDQTKKINDIVDAMKKELPAPSTGAPDRDSMQKFFQTMRETREKLNAVLTPEQQKLIPPPRFGRGNRGGGAPTGDTTTPKPNN